MSGRRREEKTPAIIRGIFLPLAGLVLLLDQLTKALAQTFLRPGASHAVLPNVFHLTLLKNTGIAFGLFQEAEKVLFIIIGLSIGLLTVIGFRTERHRLKIQWGIGLILGGALGNLVDRVRVGAVLDFLDFRVWPVFNLADTAITIGVGLFLLDFLQARRRVA